MAGKDHDSADVIVFDAQDPEDPRNWSKGKKASVVALLCALSFCSVFGSSSYAPGENQIQEEYKVNANVANTGLTVYVLGFAFGPLLWGPLSEMYGRRLSYLISWPLLIAMIAPSAWVDDIVVILVFRLLTGCAAGCALNNGAGVIADMYNNDIHAQARAMSWYAFCPLSGPCFGSIVGFFVAAHSSGKELWVVRVHFFFVIALYPLVFFLPETHSPTILARRAKALRKSGVNPRARASHELHSMSKKQLIQMHIGRPAVMLLYEPIIMGAALWISLAYGIMYFFFEVYPVVFIVQHGIPFQLGGLPFIGITIGMLLAVVPYPALVRLMERLPLPFRTDHRSTPETRLKLVLLACGMMPISLFWFAWTSGGNVPWIAATLSGIPFGFSMLTIFFTFLTYTTQIYTVYATSASACNTFVRSILASFFPVVAQSIVNNMGTQWGLSLFGFLSLGLFPIPLIFIRYGESLRARSRFAQEAAAILRKTMATVEQEELANDEGKGLPSIDEKRGVTMEV